MGILILPDPRHLCTWPMPTPKPHTIQINQHWMPVGTVYRCEECQTLWVSVAYPEVRPGRQQTVGNYWERVDNLGWRKRRRILRAIGQ